MSDAKGNPSFAVREVIAGYDHHAEQLVRHYEQIAFESVHSQVLDLLREAGKSVLDVGAGSGRDAAWFAAKGYQVTAVEPSAELRQAAKMQHKAASIRWFSDQLPSLEHLLRSKLTFDLVWLSAVWMHLPESQQRRAFRKLVSVMSPGASMMLSLRQGPPDPTRPMREVRADEVERLAQDYGLQTVRVVTSADIGGREGVTWQAIWLRLPDDGTNALPLLRHVVFNDSKSSTYKLALLRVLVRIADGASGFARSGADAERIELPLGLVALYWIRAYRPLIAKSLPQIGRNVGLSFVKEGFRGLSTQSPFDLRVGQRFTGENAKNLITAIKDAAECILKMPANFTTFPGSEERVFKGARRKQVRIFDAVQVDEAFLWSFGTFSLPANLWRAFARYAPWIEPAIVTEWIHMIRGFQKAKPESWDSLIQGLEWLEPEHDTGTVRQRVEDLRATGQSVHCVWTGKRLKKSFEIDHCFPFAAWPCNDLWNLLPSVASVNNKKRDKLPSGVALEQASERIQDWWQSAYLDHAALESRFKDETLSALPTVVSATPEAVLEGMMVQQMVLKRDQQLEEWAP